MIPVLVKLLKCTLCATMAAAFAYQGMFSYAKAVDSGQEVERSVCVSSPIFSCSDGVIIDGTTFLPLRKAMQLICENYSVEWNNTDKTAVVIWNDGEGGDKNMLRISAGKDYFVVGERYVPLGKTSFIKDNSLYVPLRKFAAALGGNIIWDAEAFTAQIVLSDEDLIGDAYNSEDLYWLSRIISAESRGEPFEGQVAVGNVILARVRSEDFPDNIHDVIFDAVPVIQFTPVENKTVFDEPQESCIAAAKLCLEGYELESVRDCLYFQNPDTTRSSWVAENRELAVKIGAHAFYY